MSTAQDFLDALPLMAELIPGRRNRFRALGYGIGRRLSEGRPTAERAMLVFVPRKSAAPREALPDTVPGTDIPIDVVALGMNIGTGPALKLDRDAVELGPASPLALRPRSWLCAAGFGVPLERPEYLLTVGHPFAGVERGARVSSFRQRIGELAIDGDFAGQDLALIRLREDVTLRSSLPDGRELSSSGAAQFLHLGTSVAFFSPVRGSLTRPRVLAISVTAFLLPWGDGAPVTQSDLIMTEVVTSPGDSGAPLFDANGTVLGLASFRTDQFSFFEGVGRGKVEALLSEAG